MYSGMMMDPEMLKLAQEQMSRISPSELAKIQQQMMSNPELIRMATESMKNMRPEDMRNAAEQLKHARPEDMAEVSEKMAKATPEEIAAMRAQVDAHFTYELNAAEMLKKQGNNLHSQGKFSDAAHKYLLAKNNLKGVPVSNSRTLQLACSLNLMSCYLKTSQYENCIKEGSEVLAYDAENVKALYRRGQAYQELGNLDGAVSDLSKAHAISPDDETIAMVLREANEKLSKAGGSQHTSQGIIIEEIMDEEVRPFASECSSASSTENLPTGIIIEEIMDEEVRPFASECSSASSTENFKAQPQEDGECFQSQAGSDTRGSTSDSECLQGLKDNTETIRSFHNFVSSANPEALDALSAGGMLPDMVKTASDMIGKMSPEELQKMLEMASSLNGRSPFFPSAAATAGHGSAARLQPPELPPNMVRTASDMVGKMSSEELQRMLEVAASMNGKDLPFSLPSDSNSQRSKTRLEFSEAAAQIPSTSQNSDEDESSSRRLFQDSSRGPSPMNVPTSTSTAATVQEQMRNQMKDPAMQQMFTSMIKNMSPDMMANMSQQFGVKLSREEAAKAQQAMSSLSPEDLDKMMRWADRIQKGIGGVRKTKNWLLGRPGLILAICMLILAIILHRLGFIGG